LLSQIGLENVQPGEDLMRPSATNSIYVTSNVPTNNDRVRLSRVLQSNHSILRVYFRHQGKIGKMVRLRLDFKGQSVQIEISCTDMAQN